MYIPTIFVGIMEETAVIDQKMRIRIPKRVSDAFGARSKEAVTVIFENGRIVISKPKKGSRMSPWFKDMIERPFRTDFPITTELLEKIGEEQWE